MFSLVFFHRPVLFLIIVSSLPSFWICHSLFNKFPIDENLDCVIEWHIVLILYSPIVILSIFFLWVCDVYWLNSDFWLCVGDLFWKGNIGRPNASWGWKANVFTACSLVSTGPKQPSNLPVLTWDLEPRPTVSMKISYS